MTFEASKTFFKKIAENDLIILELSKSKLHSNIAQAVFDIVAAAKPSKEPKTMDNTDDYEF